MKAKLRLKRVAELTSTAEPKKIRVRWTPRQKRDRVMKAVMDSLKEGPKTFDQLHKPLAHLGVSDHYVSTILADLLLHDKLIKQRIDLDDDYEEKERTYFINN